MLLAASATIDRGTRRPPLVIRDLVFVVCRRPPNVRDEPRRVGRERVPPGARSIAVLASAPRWMKHLLVNLL